VWTLGSSYTRVGDCRVTWKGRTSGTSSENVCVSLDSGVFLNELSPRTRLSPLQAPLFSPLRSISARIAQACHPPSCFQEYLVRRMPPSQSNEELPAPLTNLARQVDQRRRTAFMRRFTQLSPGTRRFMAELTLNARIMIYHLAALALNSRERSFSSRGC
jgi:hypothetical protein